MKINLPSFTREKSETCLVLDIGTGAVKALILEKKGQQNIILGAGLQYFDKFGVFNTTDFEGDVLKKAIVGAVKEARSMAPGHSKIKLIYLGLPANILRIRVISQFFKRERPSSRIKKQERDLIRQTVLKESKKRVSEVYAPRAGVLPEDLLVSSLEILDAEIDGYKVSKIEGFCGENLNFRVLAIFISKPYFNNLKNILQSLNLKITALVHEGQALPGFLESNGVFLDIGGKITQIFVVGDNKLQQVSEFDVGGEDFTKALSEGLGIREERARIFKENYSKGLLSEETQRKTREILSKASQLWFDGLKKELTEYRNFIPSNICLLGGGSLVPEIKEILWGGEWGEFQSTIFSKIQFIYPENFKKNKKYNLLLKSASNLNNIQYSSSLLIYYAKI